MNSVAHIDKELEAAMTPDELVGEFAAALRDVIAEADESYLQRDPEEAYLDLGCKLIFRLAGKIALIPKKEADRMTSAFAAQRTLAILTRWLLSNPKRNYGTRIDDDGKIELSMNDVDSDKPVRIFRGRSVQEIYAEGAQILEFIRFGGKLQ